MKKLLVSALLLSLTMTTATYAATSYGNALRNQIKQDMRDTHNDLRNAVRADAQAKIQEKTSTSQTKKAEKIKDIDRKIAQTKSEIQEIKKSKAMTETEKVLRTRPLERRLNFYYQQKEALK